MHHLVGTAEIAIMLNVTRQRVHQLTKLPTFPAPVAILSAGSIWHAEDVQRWAAERAQDPRRNTT